MPLPSQSSDLSANYGGPYVDYHPVEDPTTDLGADKLNQALADTAAMTHTAERAWCGFTCATYSGSGTDSMTVTAHDSQWGSGTDVKPTVTQASAGVYVVTWPAQVDDGIGVSHTTSIRRPHQPTLVFNSAGACAQIASTTANTITIHTFAWNDYGVTDSLNGATLYVGWS